MTTNNFTAAAEAASWEYDRHRDYTGAWNRMKFMRGAVWGRNHALAQEPTDAEVEAVKDIMRLVGSDDLDALARRTLSAARAARRNEEKR